MLQRISPNFVLNRRTMILHSIMLGLQSLAVVTDGAPFKWFGMNYWHTFSIALLIVDTLMQFTICFICWTMGSSIQLRKYNLTLVTDQHGRSQLRFQLKDEFQLQESLDQNAHDTSNFTNPNNSLSTECSRLFNNMSEENAFDFN